ncbi:MAG TPA: dipeptide ABC transporter ATP-binding protein [Methylocella sp.]|nr:dipeptide ABC transporter ATP-binding protein [Methylocella sp.]
MEPAGAPLFALRDLSVSYGGVPAVKGVSLKVLAQETVAVVGQSGSGKSQSVLGALRLLPAEARTAGQAFFKGADLLGLAQEELDALLGRRIALVFQEPMSALDPLFTVGAQIGAILRLKTGLGHRAAKARAIELLALTGIAEPTRRFDAFPHELSGGQRQRVAIAMAIACRPDLLIADEPTTALDVTVAARILDLLAELKENLGMAMVFISHDLNHVRRIADRIYVFEAGAVVEDGTASELFTHPRHTATRRLAAALPQARRRGAACAPELLRADNITVQFALRGGLFEKRRLYTAVDHVSLVLAEGRTLGLVGESGSGKSTLARALLKLVPASGRIVFQGRDLTPLDQAALRPLRRAMQLVFQDPFSSLSPTLRVGAIVTEGLSVHEPGLSRKTRDEKAAEALSQTHLDPELRHRFAFELSGGQRQRVAIARAIILKPRLIVLDEPTSALDRNVQASILALLQDLQAGLGLTYVLISHDLAVVRALADEMAVMKNGQIIEQGPAKEILEMPREAYTRTLIAAAFEPEESRSSTQGRSCRHGRPLTLIRRWIRPCKSKGTGGRVFSSEVDTGPHIAGDVSQQRHR